MTNEKSASIWTRAFALLCLAQFLGYAQHFMLAPVLPLYVTDLGGSPFVVGLVLASFAVTSVVIRPLVGHWADRWSETGVLISGLLFQGASVFLCLIPMIEVVMLSRCAARPGLGLVLNTGRLFTIGVRPLPKSEACGGFLLPQRRPRAPRPTPFQRSCSWLSAASWGGFHAARSKNSINFYYRRRASE